MRHRFNLLRSVPAVIIVVVTLVMAACAGESDLDPFSSDGCSLFPDSAGITRDDWCSCCFEHDIAYWKGGTEAERLEADTALMRCVKAKTGSEVLARSMFAGVRVGGSPKWFTWYRWGYGWGFERQYQPLSPVEAARAASLIQSYYASGQESVCRAENDNANPLRLD